jgi:hypothetical protein
MRVARALSILITAELLGAGGAHAQTDPTATQWAATDFLIRVLKRDGDKFVYIPENEAQLEFFNKARCLCEEAVQISVDLSPTGVAKRSLITEGNVRLMVGPDSCVDAAPDVRNAAGCIELGQRKLGDLGANGWIQETTVKALFDARPNASGCDVQVEQHVWLFLTTNNKTTPDLTGNAAPNLALSLDGQPPEAPADIKVTGGNEALNVSWTRQSGQSGFNGYVVFCARGGTLPVFNPSFYDSHQFSSPGTACPDKVFAMAPLVTFADTGSTGTAVAPPIAFRTLDPAFTCSGLLTTAGEARISILENKVPYVVGVTAIDNHGNPSPIEVAYLQTPIPTRDFYQGYRDAGGTAEGGYCAYGPGRPGWFAIAGVALALVLWRRRR